MTEQLHQRLADLAGDAASPAPVDTGEIWRAGKRRQRRRTAAAGLAACALVLAGVAGGGLLLPQVDGFDAAPVAGESMPALPDELHVPGRWLASNDGDPVGPFAALLSASQGWSGDTAYVGVSALTGEYRTVELPGGGPAAVTEVALSPSGRYLAYWLDRGSPGSGVGGDAPVDGIAVYDTTSGEVERQEIGSPKGLEPEEMFWADDDRLYFQVAEIERITVDADGGSRSSRIKGPGWIWHMSREHELDLLEVPGMARIPDVIASDGTGHLALRAKGKGAGLLLADPDRPGDVRALTVPPAVSLANGGAISPQGAVAGFPDAEAGTLPGAVLVGRGGQAKEVPRVTAYRILGWAGDRVVVQAGDQQLDRAPRSTNALVSVDPATGDQKVMTRLPSGDVGGYANVHAFATDLLDVPPVDRGEPDFPADPRVFIGLGAGALLLLLLALRTWRRREQR